MTDLDPRALRDAFGSFMTGVTIVTTMTPDGVPVGFTANSFTSVSLDPPMLLVCPGRYLSSFAAFETCDRFAVNVLAEGQEEVSNIFAAFKGDRFSRVNWQPDELGCPVLEGAVARFACRKTSVIPAGDHVILLGQVAAFGHPGGFGLGYSEGSYFSLGLEYRASAGHAHRSFAGAIVERDATVLLRETAAGFVLPTIELDGDAGAREAMTAWFAVAGIEVDLVHVYSIFTDRGNGSRYTYLTARTGDNAPDAFGTFVPLAQINDIDFADPALASMMNRFALEHRNRSFSLYVGDESRGDIHTLTTGT